ncbi:histidine phosphatase family protein [Knoellia subterranea]|uniref:Fructose-2,6-bisphosphatase n=1 Tax=Knoellia subterranea KCTC 19937 TaxID=1385521 RepID=A0A0A0JL72_9MICO|nr:histidine phosphatase family protein [Knoellia subterranea]KGN38185.1 fructose-2,6-bisphosphatase [Knoellia subterranea KCTC 19937]
MTRTARASSVDDRTVVHLVRHGEVHNPDRILYGRLPDYHLSDLGRQMADLVASHLADHDITHVISSPLERAQETAAPIAAAHDLTIELDERALEAENAFEGRAVAGGKGIFRDPKMWKLMVNPLRPSWGEPYVQLAERMQLAVDDARAAARGHEAVIVSHQAPIWMLRLAIEGRRFVHDPRKRQCSLASMTSLTYRGDELESLAYSEPAAALLPMAQSGAGA